MQWMIELGRINIATKILLLLSHLVFPRLGHLLIALHVMAYLKQKHNSRLVFDTAYHNIDLSIFPQQDWTEFYGDIAEAIPDSMPLPLGKDVYIRMWVDSDHAVT